MTSTDMNNIIPILIGVLLVGFVFWAFIGLSNTAASIHGKLDEFMERAKATNDQSQLRLLHSELIQYANKECWHKHLGSHAREVSAFIRGKMQLT